MASKTRVKKLHGFIAWKGKSEIDGNPIVLIITRGMKGGENKKTGAMVQTYILRSDMSPLEAAKTGEDFSICGDCRHTKSNQGTCYVRVETGPLIVYKGIALQRYPRISPKRAEKELAGDIVRIGSYGDPCAVPFRIWETILGKSSAWSGYTHQWKNPRMLPFAKFCMASCDSLEENKQAIEKHWRSFLVVPKETKKIEGSFLCPASEEAGRKLTCIECKACSGTGSGRKASVFIPVHGVAYKIQRFNTSNLIQIGRN